MKELKTEELCKIDGGNGVVIGLSIVAGITFIIGVIDGQARLR